MSLFTKPCGCKGRKKLTKDYKHLNNKTKNFEHWDGTVEDKVLMSTSGKFRNYTSTDILRKEIEENELEEKYYTVTSKVEYLVYGCLKCGQTWREEYKTRTSKDWKE